MRGDPGTARGRLHPVVTARWAGTRCHRPGFRCRRTETGGGAAACAIVGHVVFAEKPAVVGHRGFGRGMSGGHRENTVESCLAAAAAGLPWIEVDAQRTADDQLVLSARLDGAGRLVHRRPHRRRTRLPGNRTARRRPRRGPAGDGHRYRRQDGTCRRDGPEDTAHGHVARRGAQCGVAAAQAARDVLRSRAAHRHPARSPRCRVRPAHLVVFSAAARDTRGCGPRT